MTRNKNYNNSEGRDPAGSLTRRVKHGDRHHAGVYEEIVYGHPDALKGYTDITTSFQNSDIRIVPVADETVSEAVFRKRCIAALERIHVDGDPTKGLKHALGELSDSIVFGATVMEAVWKKDGVIELYPIPLSSIDRWANENGKAVPYQYTTALNVDRLIHVCPFRKAGPEGIAVLRPLVFPFRLWKRTLQDMGIRVGRERGSIILKQPLTADNESVESALDAIDALVVGDTPSALLPPDWDWGVPELPSATSNLDIIEYCDQKIRSLMDDTVTSLVNSAYGSRALSDTISNEDSEKSDGKLELCISLFGSEFFKQVARGYDYVGRFPTMTSLPESEVDPAKRVHVLTNAYKLTGWTEDDREDLRRLLGLQPLHEGGPILEVRDNLIPYGTAVEMSSDPDFSEFIDAESIDNFVKEHTSVLADDLEDIAENIRKDINDNLTDKEFEDLRKKHVASIDSAIQEYIEALMEDGLLHGRAIAERMESAGSVGRMKGEPNYPELETVIDRLYDKATISSETAARAIFGRIVSEKENNPDNDDARATGEGLAQEAAMAGHSAMQGASIEGAKEYAEENGLALFGAVRSAVLDKNVCGVCKEKDGKHYTFKQMLADPVPDQSCKGTAKKCRCYWIMKLAR